MPSSAARLLRLGVVAAVGLDEVLCEHQRSPANVSFGDQSPLLRGWQLWAAAPEAVAEASSGADRTYQTWFLSIAAACVVGLSGVVPLLLVPVDTGIGSKQSQSNESPVQAHLTLGLWVLLGVFTFIVLELVFSSTGPRPDQSLPHSDVNQNGVTKPASALDGLKTIHVTGYLNLMANGIDNFTHGLAVAASFLVGIKMGVVTTLAILIHEIPHEVGDFAILLKSGFNRWDAAKAQVFTAAVGVAGAVTALSADSLEDMDMSTSWILPFTSGGFLNIALVSVLPDLLKEEDPWESSKQLGCVCSGIAVMAAMQAFLE